MKTQSRTGLRVRWRSAEQLTVRLGTPLPVIGQVRRGASQRPFLSVLRTILRRDVAP